MSWVGCSLLLVVAGLVVGGYHQAGFKEWELLNRVPTYSVEESKRLGVYETTLNFRPTEVDLIDTRYKIEQVWAEHRTSVDRVNFFTVRQKNLPDLVLCVRMREIGRNPSLAQSGVSISTANAKQTYGAPVSGEMCVSTGEAVPTSFVVSSVTREAEVRIELSRP